MNCYVYKSGRKPGHYVYLREDDGGAALPESIRQLLQPLERVMALQLHPDRKLARENPAAVMESLERQGFHLQLPPPDPALAGGH
ncbi:MAG: YcgL domain-containing protein [Xanthomonadales bacterium]|jgi:hypothetical protein|nr:YcgL domain-containing protein [Xanthomonadales bacterium]